MQGVCAIMSVPLRKVRRATGREEVTSVVNPFAHRTWSKERLSDEELVEMAKAGDDEAFGILVQRYQDRIYNLTYRYVNNEEDALDLTQDTFLKAFTKLKHFRGNSKFYTWLYRIAVNVCIDFQRRQHLTVVHWDDLRPLEFTSVESNEPVEPFELPDHQGQPERELLVSELRQRVREAIDELPQHLRVVIILREYEDLSYDEIARIVGCRVGTVKSRLFQAREMLKKKLAPYVQE